MELEDRVRCSLHVNPGFMPRLTQGHSNGRCLSEGTGGKSNAVPHVHTLFLSGVLTIWVKQAPQSNRSVVSIYPHRLLAFRQNVRPGEGSVPTGPTTGKLQSLMTSRAEKGTQDLSVDA